MSNCRVYSTPEDGPWFLELKEGGASYARTDRNVHRDTAGVIVFGENYYVVPTTWLSQILWSRRGPFVETEETVKSVHIGMLINPELPTKESPRYEASYHGLREIKGTLVTKKEALLERMQSLKKKRDEDTKLAKEKKHDDMVKLIEYQNTELKELRAQLATARALQSQPLLASIITVIIVAAGLGLLATWTGKWLQFPS